MKIRILDEFKILCRKEVWCCNNSWLHIILKRLFWPVTFSIYKRTFPYVSSAQHTKNSQTKGQNFLKLSIQKTEIASKDRSFFSNHRSFPETFYLYFLPFFDAVTLRVWLFLHCGYFSNLPAIFVRSVMTILNTMCACCRAMRLICRNTLQISFHKTNKIGNIFSPKITSFRGVAV